MAFKKTFLTLVCCLTILSAAATGTLAYYHDSSAPLTNTFFPGRVETQVEEDLDGDVKSNVRLKNTGNTPAYIRAFFLLSWKAEDGSVHFRDPEGVQLQLGDGWVKAIDGFYYWPAPVPPGGETDPLILTCDPGNSVAPAGFSLNLEVVGSALQSDPPRAVLENWGSAVVKVEDTGYLRIRTGGSV